MADYYINNTNRKEGAHYEVDMLQNHKCAAYGTTKEHMEDVSNESKVLWYASEVGLIGGGISDGVTHKKEVDGKPDFEYYQLLTDVHKFIQPLSHRKLKALIPNLRVLNGTLLKINTMDGEKLWVYLLEHGMKEKQKR
ncbi:hypothetical protein [Paenibacillus lignilyticus]|uniref:Uncharacterized protein n=1 Tax=Paenibacillus lignilyticus TaxID=1172615 RepID=A0ABS5CKX9_9BACL|nr:hypothetical protein [Paenibacillus lignilyticus]MBP3966527.1 hypothetical protein [Paenibacillus lignilyticus]